MKKHFDVVVKGKVQGVFYRASTLEKASELGIKGIVKNLSNGNVFIEAEGEEDVLKSFLGWCKIGPSRARVQSLDINEGEIKNYSSFAIVR